MCTAEVAFMAVVNKSCISESKFPLAKLGVRSICSTGFHQEWVGLEGVGGRE